MIGGDAIPVESETADVGKRKGDSMAGWGRGGG